MDGTSRNLFSFAMWAERIFYFLVDLLPPFMRLLVFRLALGSCGKRVMIDYGTYLRYPWRIHIGDDVLINHGCRFFPPVSPRSHSIHIAQGVILAPGVTLFGAGHEPNADRKDVSGPIIIGQGAYVGGNATIRYGVTIGRGAVIGAGSVVVKDVPDFAVAVGNPAVVKGYSDS